MGSHSLELSQGFQQCIRLKLPTMTLSPFDIDAPFAVEIASGSQTDFDGNGGFGKITNSKRRKPLRMQENLGRRKLNFR
jgi:hypothetical protein